MCGPPVKCELSRLKLTVKPRLLAPFQFLITTHNYAALRREYIILKQNQKVRPGPHLSMCDMVHINHVPTSSGFFYYIPIYHVLVLIQNVRRRDLLPPFTFRVKPPPSDYSLSTCS